jgi:hypothetical protein
MVPARAAALICALGVLSVGGVQAAEADGPVNGRECFEMLVPMTYWSSPIAAPAGSCFVQMDGGQGWTATMDSLSGFVVFLDRDGSARTRRLLASDGRSMPGPLWNDSTSVGLLRVPELAPGLAFTGVRASGSFVAYLVSDGTVVGRDDVGDLVIPELPEGLSYVDAHGGGVYYRESPSAVVKATILVLLRSDGVVLVVDQEKARAGAVGAIREVRASEGRVFVRVVAASRFVIMLDSEGHPSAQWYTPQLKNGESRKSVDTSRLDPNERFVDIATNGYDTFYLRQDGSVLELDGWGWFDRPEVIRANPGVRFVELLDRDMAVSGLLSDGNAMGLSHQFNPCGDDDMADCDARVVPLLAKGYRWVAMAWTGDSGLYGAVRIPAGKRVVSSIGRMLTVRIYDYPQTNVALSKQKKGWLWVEVSSRGQTKGGLVVVKRGSKVVGKGRMGSGDVVKVALRMGSLKVGKNLLTVRFRGKGVVTPSITRTVNVTVKK